MPAPPRVYGPAVFNDSDPHCNDISVYYRMVDAQERSPMIPCPQYAIWKYCPAWKQIRKEERDEVLERLHIWFENYCEGNEDSDLWVAFLHAERTLRQAGEP